ncbi:MAG: peptidoglycan DD-metalloendopeptidase family protein [Gammaproteobacteria bacterium]|nr:peptidoglycan DD-metalloendopeptidase family protein [Gammaproteobacteria bacterium]NNJ97607.1 peptidoglycan DD-metalloendopeptidase family protein [Gammaproteobacteria bacterium]
MKICGLLACALITLYGCSNQRWDPSDYPVTSGETIYSIAWKYEIDPFELARWNGLTSPYRIYPGLRLKMKPTSKAGGAKPTQTRAKRHSGPRPRTVTVRSGDSLSRIAYQYDLSTQQLASINGIKSPYIIHPGQTLRLTASKATHATKPPTKPIARPAKQTTTASLPSENSKINWQWPVSGKLIATFNGNKSDRKGINIAAKEGKAIKAAAPGKVVYSGNGLISYGNLVIIKHNRTYLSAYAHNRRLLVKEGEIIKSGQKIAELGKTGTDSPYLHFEIRKNGKPVNPLEYLPRS